MITKNGITGINTEIIAEKVLLCGEDIEDTHGRFAYVKLAKSLQDTSVVDTLHEVGYERVPYGDGLYRFNVERLLWWHNTLIEDIKHYYERDKDEVVVGDMTPELYQDLRNLGYGVNQVGDERWVIYPNGEPSEVYQP